MAWSTFFFAVFVVFFPNVTGEDEWFEIAPAGIGPPSREGSAAGSS